MIDPAIIATTIANLLATARHRWKVVSSTDGAFDFFIEDAATGDRLAVEAVAKSPTPEAVKRLSRRLEGISDVAEVWAVTADAQAGQADTSAGSVRTVPINRVPELLGIASPGDLRDPKVQASLQMQAIVNNYARYKSAPIGLEAPARRGARARAARTADAPAQNLANESRFLHLRRQLSFQTIAALDEKQGDSDSILAFGTPVRDVTVVLSDLKNFSSLVTASAPDVLREAMSRYYFKARALVFEHRGMLDKFIGDAVLAVFGYPVQSPSAALDALKFARGLVELGATTLRPWSQEINAVLETGTRVGVATGPIWPINIGEAEMEISLLGDTINLAARLEKNATVNAVLLANTTRTKASAADQPLVDSWGLIEETVSTSDAKGQAFETRAWRMPQLTPVIKS